jgi:hypothetical protein
MNIDRRTIRLLGAAFLLVFVASMLSGSLLTSATGSGNISDILANIPDNLTLMRISILVELVTSIGIVVLAALLYIVFREQYRIVASVALGWWLAEAIVLAVSKIGAFALIPLSQEYVSAGAPETSYFQTLGDFLYYGIDRQGWTIHMLFFCLGGVLWYSLFFRSRVIPRAFAAWGLVAISLVSINVLLGLYDRNFELVMIMLAPYLVFEALIGPWLMIRGVSASSEAKVAPRFTAVKS